MFDIQPIAGQPYREPGAAVGHVIIGSPLPNERHIVFWSFLWVLWDYKFVFLGFVGYKTFGHM